MRRRRRREIAKLTFRTLLSERTIRSSLISFHGLERPWLQTALALSLAA